MSRFQGIALVLCLACGLAAQTTDDERTLALLRAADCQTSLPGEELAGRSHEAPSRRDPVGPRRPPSEAKRNTLSLPCAFAGGGLAQVLLWVGVAVAVLLLVASIARTQRGGAGRAADTVRGASGGGVGGEAVAEPPLPDYEQLAALGDFAAAVHSLLRHAIGAWVARGGALPPHATARELLRRVHGVAVPEASLAHLVHAVEIVHFGGRPADRGLFEASRDHLHRWEAACRPPA